ncbi:2-oxoglutarate ferredoxin oxidoreductase subunit delta [Desulfacinum hydrothermale DSM 13146]|uniref:2-oxoglutarate ferredoxin oxidoreductase subunit delta n=1 Tax=Desulfacinum hydrothermale DSM 13146 TaxID=1121390 RepID=A0A1W1XQB4_9BACT|nr:4Fe-4S dicluster domain-containing protein [Desulfacinum hydrothermale]SMC26064.1 2-oxoglutarate ferredoxin oxidoreductase subunit delta [Desulfacinum hydrothermale DSM 13146]
MGDETAKKTRKKTPQESLQEESTDVPVDPLRKEASEGAKPSRAKKDYDIAIFMGWCKGCGICAAFCPRQCIEMDEDGSPVVTQPDRCTGCGFCEIHCPDFAISVRARRKKAVGDDD